MKYIYILMVCLIMFGCSSIKQKSMLIGNWSSINSSNIIDLEFSEDSLIIGEWGRKNIYGWNIHRNYIYFDSIKINEYKDKEKSNYSYNFELVGDTLFLRKKQDDIKFLKLIRIDNAFDYFNKSLNLNLPIQANLTPVLNEEFAYILYVLYENENVILKKSDNTFLDLIDLKRDVNLHIANTELNNVSKISVMLFADKNVPNLDILEIKNTIKEVNSLKIFQIFTNEKVFYEKFSLKQKIEWFGILE